MALTTTMVTFECAGPNPIQQAIIQFDNAQLIFDVPQTIPTASGKLALLDFISRPGGYGFGEFAILNLSTVYVKNDSGNLSFFAWVGLIDDNDTFINAQVTPLQGSDFTLTTSDIIVHYKLSGESEYGRRAMPVAK